MSSNPGYSSNQRIAERERLLNRAVSVMALASEPTVHMGWTRSITRATRPYHALPQSQYLPTAAPSPAIPSALYPPAHRPHHFTAGSSQLPPAPAPALHDMGSRPTVPQPSSAPNLVTVKMNLATSARARQNRDRAAAAAARQPLTSDEAPAAAPPVPSPARERLSSITESKRDTATYAARQVVDAPPNHVQWTVAKPAAQEEEEAAAGAERAPLTVDDAAEQAHAEFVQRYGKLADDISICSTTSDTCSTCTCSHSSLSEPSEDEAEDYAAATRAVSDLQIPAAAAKERRTSFTTDSSAGHSGSQPEAISALHTSSAGAPAARPRPRIAVSTGQSVSPPLPATLAPHLQHASPTAYDSSPAAKAPGLAVAAAISGTTKGLSAARQAQLLDVLLSMPLFHVLGRFELRRLLENVFEIEYQPGDWVLRQGDRGRDMFLILEGEVHVYGHGHMSSALSACRAHEHGAPFDPGVSMGRLTALDFFGERSLLEAFEMREAEELASARESVLAAPPPPPMRTASVQVTDRGTLKLMVVTLSVFEALLARTPVLSMLKQHAEQLLMPRAIDLSALRNHTQQFADMLRFHSGAVATSAAALAADALAVKRKFPARRGGPGQGVVHSVNPNVGPCPTGMDAAVWQASRSRVVSGLEAMFACFNPELGVDDLVEQLLSVIPALFNCDRVGLFFVDPAKHKLLLRLKRGVPAVQLPMSGIAGSAAVSGVPERVDDAYVDPRFNKDFDMSSGYTTRNMLVMPVFDAPKASDVPDWQQWGFRRSALPATLANCALVQSANLDALHAAALDSSTPGANYTSTQARSQELQCRAARVAPSRPPVAVLQVLNKHDNRPWTREDEQMLAMIGMAMGGSFATKRHELAEHRGAHAQSTDSVGAAFALYVRGVYDIMVKKSAQQQGGAAGAPGSPTGAGSPSLTPAASPGSPRPAGSPSPGSPLITRSRSRSRVPSMNLDEGPEPETPGSPGVGGSSAGISRSDSKLRRMLSNWSASGDKITVSAELYQGDRLLCPRLSTPVARTAAASDRFGSAMLDEFVAVQQSREAEVPGADPGAHAMAARSVGGFTRTRSISSMPTSTRQGRTASVSSPRRTGRSPSTFEFASAPDSGAGRPAMLARPGRRSVRHGDAALLGGLSDEDDGASSVCSDGSYCSAESWGSGSAGSGRGRTVISQAEWPGSNGTDTGAVLRFSSAVRDLPRASRVIFTVQCNGKVIGWAGMRLFDYSRRMLTGRVALGLWPGSCPAPTAPVLNNMFDENPPAVLVLQIPDPSSSGVPTVFAEPEPRQQNAGQAKLNSDGVSQAALTISQDTGLAVPMPRSVVDAMAGFDMALHAAAAANAFHGSDDEEEEDSEAEEPEDLRGPMELLDSGAAGAPGMEEFKLPDMQEEPMLSSLPDIVQECIRNDDPLAQPNADVIAALWRHRASLVHVVAALPPFLHWAVSWGDRDAVAEVYTLLLKWRRPPPAVALRLLDSSVPDPKVRAFAVNALSAIGDDDLRMVLLQLVQLIKFEPFTDSALARLLLRRALAQPYTIAPALYWYCKAECGAAHAAERYSAILELLLRHLAPDARARMGHCAYVMKALHDVAVRVRKASKSTSKRTTVLRTELKRLILPPRFRLPVCLGFEVQEVDIAKCRVMGSKQAPLWLTLRGRWTHGQIPQGAAENEVVILFKQGDDVRQDALVLQLMAVMVRLWRSMQLPLRLTLYEVAAIGPRTGVIQVVQDAETLARVMQRASNRHAPDAPSAASSPSRTAVLSRKLKASKQAYNTTTLLTWLREQAGASAARMGAVEADQWKLVQGNFVHTCAAYSVATYVLGIGDRHSSNIMITRLGELFHIDFGHILGNFKRKFGVKRERAPIKFTPTMAEVLGGEGAPAWQEFMILACRSYEVLRRFRKYLLTLLVLMAGCGLPELQSSDDVQYARDRLLPELPADVAEADFQAMVQRALRTKFAQHDDWFHLFKHA